MSSYDYLYIDCGTGSLLGGNSWCDPYKTWKKIYTLELPNNDNILGASATSWSEIINDYALDGRLWPRSSVLGEVLWTNSKEDSVPKVARRLGAHGLRLL